MATVIEHSDDVFDGFEEIPEIDLEIHVQPYMYEPTKNQTQLESSSSSDESSDDDLAAVDGQVDDDWCSCGECIIMPSSKECLCCRDVNRVVEKIDDNLSCITEHEGFMVNCLNHHVLETSYYEYVLDNGPSKEPIHELYRYISYRRFTRWVWGLLGKRNRKILPSCVVTKIRAAFPSEQYCGFKYPK